MDFGALPPEINSARMYAGPGSGPMMAAAAGWDELAADLYSMTTSYHSIISGLTSGPWLGPASVSMAAAAATYVTWLATTAAQTEQTAAQAQAAAGAFETAFAATVPPPLIAANRSLLMELIAKNTLGQNTPAIAATEAQYGEMWAQDAAAMYGYAGASAAASTLTPFAPPMPITRAGGLAGQAAAAGQATSTSAGTATQTTLSQLTSAVPPALQSLVSPASSSTSPLSILNNVNPFLSSTSQVAWMTAAGLSSANQLKSLAPAVSTATTTGANGLGSVIASGLGSGTGAFGSTGLGAGGISAAVSAGMGRVASIGPLSIPPTWAAAAPTVTPGASALGTGISGALPAGTAGSLGPPLMPMANTIAGRGGPGTGLRLEAARPSVIPTTPAAG